MWLINQFPWKQEDLYLSMRYTSRRMLTFDQPRVWMNKHGDSYIHTHNGIENWSSRKVWL